MLYSNFKTEIMHGMKQLRYFPWILGIVFLILFKKFGLSFSLIKYSLLFALLIPLALLDYSRREVYIFPIYIGSIAALLLAVIEDNLIDSILGGIVGFTSLTIIIRLSGEAIGEGDRDLMLLCGLFLGLKSIWMMMLLAFVSGALISLILILLKQVKLSDELAFAPFITLSTFLILLYYEEITSWYMNMIQYLI